MSLKSTIINDVASVFLNSDDFAEDVTFVTASGKRRVSCLVEMENLNQEFRAGDRNRVVGSIWIQSASVKVAAKEYCIVRNLYRCVVESVGIPEDGMQRLSVVYTVERYSNARELDPI